MRTTSILQVFMPASPLGLRIDGLSNNLSH